jgi:hypothetical protein
VSLEVVDVENFYRRVSVSLFEEGLNYTGPAFGAAHHDNYQVWLVLGKAEDPILFLTVYVFSIETYCWHCFFASFFSHKNFSRLPDVAM